MGSAATVEAEGKRVDAAVQALDGAWAEWRRLHAHEIRKLVA